MTIKIFYINDENEHIYTDVSVYGWTKNGIFFMDFDDSSRVQIPAELVASVWEVE